MEEDFEEKNYLRHLQFLNLGLSSVIRYKNSRSELGVLNQSVSEHVVNMLNILDVYKEELDKRYDIDWHKVNKMVRYHDVGEIDTGDIVSVFKTEKDREVEAIVTRDIVSDFPAELGDEILDYLQEKEEHESIEARLVHAIDKIEPEILIATEKGIEEIRDLHRRLGVDVASFAIKKFEYLRNILVEWELDELIELVEEIWEKQKELGILDEDPQLSLELEVKKELEEELEII